MRKACWSSETKGYSTKSKEDDCQEEISEEAKLMQELKSLDQQLQ